MEKSSKVFSFPRNYPNPEIIKDTIDKFGWKLVDFVDPKINKGTKAYFNAFCSNGHKTKTMMQLFRQQVVNKGKPPCKQCSQYSDSKLELLREEVDKIGDEQGVEILSYPKNNKERFLYRCSCGKEGKINLCNARIRLTPLKCSICYQENRQCGKKKVDFSRIENFCDENEVEILSDKSYYKNEDTLLICICSCGEKFKKSWRNLKYSPRCEKCSKTLEGQTKIEKYGNANVAKTDHFKKKSVETYMKKYGVPHNMKDEGVRKKVKETNRKNCGYDSNLSDPRCVEKRLRTMGGKSGYAIPEIQTKANDTCIKRYGKIINLGDDETYQHYLKKSKNTKYFELDDGRKILYESGYEKTFLETLKELEILEYIERPSFYSYKLEGEDKYRHYYPDYSFSNKRSKKDFLAFMSLYIDVSVIEKEHCEEILIELKSNYYYELHKEKNICKWKYVPFNKPLFVIFCEKNKIKKVELYYRILA